MAIKLQCPSCGAEVEFRSKISVFSVCGFCQHMLVRHDLNVEDIGVMSELPDEMTPFQIGTRGKYEGSTFEIVGRLRVQWVDGYWNEWFIQFDSGRQGWLAEAQGFYMVSFDAVQEGSIPVSEVPKLNALQLGRNTKLGKFGNFQVDDIKRAKCIGSEGELPFRAPRGLESTSVDLSGSQGQFANLEYPDDGQTRLYLGKYVEFNDLKLTGLRELEGW